MIFYKNENGMKRKLIKENKIFIESLRFFFVIASCFFGIFVYDRIIYRHNLNGIIIISIQCLFIIVMMKEMKTFRF